MRKESTVDHLLINMNQLRKFNKLINAIALLEQVVMNKESRRQIYHQEGEGSNSELENEEPLLSHKKVKEEEKS